MILAGVEIVDVPLLPIIQRAHVRDQLHHSTCMDPYHGAKPLRAAPEDSIMK